MIGGKKSRDERGTAEGRETTERINMKKVELYGNTK